MTPLRVGFNARLLSHPSLRGWNRYAINLRLLPRALAVDSFDTPEKPEPAEKK